MNFWQFYLIFFLFICYILLSLSIRHPNYFILYVASRFVQYDEYVDCKTECYRTKQVLITKLYTASVHASAFRM